MEDVPADQPELLLHVVRPDHLVVDDRVVEVRRELVVEVEDPLRVRVQLVPVGLLHPIVGDPLREHREHVRPFGRELLVHRRRDRSVDERRHGRLPVHVRVLERLLRVVRGEAQLDRARVMVLELLAGLRLEVRQLADRDVDLDDAAPRLPALDVPHEIRRELVPVDQVEERDLRVDAADHDRGAELLTVVEDDADGASVADDDLLHAGPRADLAPERLGGRPDRAADAAHPALLEPPGAEVAVADVPDRVMEHHVGGARLVRTGPRPDHAVHREHALDGIGLEPVVEQIGDAHREQAGDVAHAPFAELAHLPRDLDRRQQIHRMHRADVRGDAQHQRAEHVGNALEPGLPLRHRVRVALRELGDRVVGPLRFVGVDGDRTSVGIRLEVRAEGCHVVAELLQPELADDRVGHQRHHVGVVGDVDLRGDPRTGAPVRRAAGLVPCLRTTVAGRRGRSTHRSRVRCARPDDDRVVGVGCHARARLLPDGRRDPRIMPLV